MTGPKFRRIILSVAILSLIAVIVFVASGGRDVALLAAPFAFLGFVVLVALGFHGGSRRIDRDYARLPDHNRLVTYEISANLIALRSDVTSSEALWRGIVRAYRTPKGFLLYQTDRETHWLPVSGFQNSADIERLAQMLKSNAKEYNDVR
jgi:hypothetical protein